MDIHECESRQGVQIAEIALRRAGSEGSEYMHTYMRCVQFEEEEEEGNRLVVRI